MTGRRVLCTQGHGDHASLLAVALPALERYADRHHFDLHIVRHRVAPERPAAWDKVALLRALVDDYETVGWIDADAIIVDGAPDIAAACDPSRSVHLVEHRIAQQRIPNSGVMVLTEPKAATRLLDRLWTKREYTHHRWWENAALLDLLGYSVTPPVYPVRPSRWRRLIGRLDHAWNSIPADPSPRPYIRHFPGLPIGDRLHEMQMVSSSA